MPTQTNLLAKSGVSFAVFQDLLLNGQPRTTSHWVTLLELTQKGYLALGPNKIQLTHRGSALLLGEIKADPVFASALLTIFDPELDGAGKEVVFDRQGKPNFGFEYPMGSAGDDAERDWLLKNKMLSVGPYWHSKRIIPMIIVTLVVCFTALLATQVWPLWFAAVLMSGLLVSVMTGQVYLPTEKGREMILAYKCLPAKSMHETAWAIAHDPELLSWVLHKRYASGVLNPEKNLFRQLYALDWRPTWWIGPDETIATDLTALLVAVDRAYPEPPRHYDHGTASAGA